MYKHGALHIHSCNLWNCYRFVLTSMGILILCCIFRVGENFLFVRISVRPELFKYWIKCNIKHWVNRRSFCRLASGFVHFISCLSSSTHTFLCGYKKNTVISVCQLALYGCVMMLGEPTQWLIGFYLYSSPGWLLITIHNVVCEPCKCSLLYSNEIHTQLIFPLTGSQKCPWPL